jgi:preprotein translocase subunit YajC
MICDDILMKSFFNVRIQNWVVSSTFGLMGAVFFMASAFADGPAVPAGSMPAPAGASGAAMSQPGGIMAFLPFILMFAVMYFLILRPQQKKMKEQQNMLAALKHGDEILTASGILGKVTGITEKVVTVEVADNVRVKMLKNQISQVIKGSVKDIAS